MKEIIKKLEGEVRHDFIVSHVAKRLKKYGNYSFVKTHVEYYDSNKNVLGEADVLAYDSKHNVLHFYEIKGRYSKKNFGTAKKQYRRFNVFTPNKVLGVYVSPQKVKRLK